MFLLFRLTNLMPSKVEHLQHLLLKTDILLLEILMEI